LKAVTEQRKKIREAGRSFNIPKRTVRRRLISNTTVNIN
jgi:hypothetical protein